jgi:hypothetical protein
MHIAGLLQISMKTLATAFCVLGAGMFFTVRTALAVNQQNAQNPQSLNRIMRILSESFGQKSEQLRKAKPSSSAATP